ncbi:complex 1 protein [Oesophagostomum dentatum]|uniref:Complex 1 protein n=1 Tax=Oesophagostomum dentatum TaxID=61180 RepID=A0A0B1TKB4_OESDE|nr:complex 1 protein [Oesophagostomum dentatum]
MSVQRQLREDWDNREYEQLMKYNYARIMWWNASELSCRSKLATLSDRLNLLEKKVEFLEARVQEILCHKMSAAGKAVQKSAGVFRRVAPVQSISKEQARRAVLQSYKDLQRMTPKFWWDFGMTDMPLGVFRSVLKQQFMKNAHITDLRVIDRLVGETKQVKTGSDVTRTKAVV